MSITKWIIYVVVLLGACLSGCANTTLQGDSPPKVVIDIANVSYPTKLGTYCWQEKCVDTSGPIDMLKESEPMKVRTGETIKLKMEVELPPTSMELSILNENEEKISMELQDFHFAAPTQKGIYYFSFSLRWQKDNISIGDALYAFALEVD
ncbi:hypothetical protein ACIQXI_05745 [Lysinibacillus sp. NPDC097195]|uniref:hypothetical protein n=1 Tax=Lysinibacillus sp. NPDC097195 TaxID=3364141 RepID=UPI00380E0988